MNNDYRINRRTFSLGLGSTLALTVIQSPGCSRSSPPPAPKLDENTPTEPAKSSFLIGEPSKYLAPGLYADFKNQGVWLVSDGQILIALNPTCTHSRCLVKRDPQNQQFVCPCHKSRFDLQGDNLQGSKAKRPLERFATTLAQTDAGKQIQIHPKRSFRKDDKIDQFNDPQASFNLV